MSEQSQRTLAQPTIGSEDTGVRTRFIPCAQVPKWTFENTAVKRWVEEWLQGRVLNACAGKTQLTHDGKIVRNDIDPERDADLHIDISELRDHFSPESFDTIVFDPPYSVYQSNLRYGGRQVGHAKVAKEGFDELLRPGGHVIELGYHGTCMPGRLQYERVERAWFCTVGRHKDVLGSVDRKTQTKLATDGGRDRQRPRNERFGPDADPYDLREALGDSWGEKVLVRLDDGEPAEHYAAVPGKSHIREAWPDHLDEPVWMHVNEVGYRLDQPYDHVTWEIRDWDDCPVSADWEVVYP